MRLDKLGSVYALTSEYSENSAPKGAGFFWHGGGPRCSTGRCDACKAGAGRLWWTAEPKKAAKLLDLGAPWVVEMTDEVRAELVAAGAARTAAIEASRATDADVALPVPDGLAYLPYQKAGIAFALSHPNVLIGDEMGLGKTIQAVGVINADPSLRKILVICPASLKLNWLRELEKWLTRPLRVRLASSKYWPTAATDIVIANYDILGKHPQRLADEYDLVVVDECHYAKNPKAQRSKAVYAIKARRRVALTGTPILNRPVELQPIVAWLDPLEPRFSFFPFAKRFCAAHRGSYGWDFSGASNLDELQLLLRERLMVRRLKAEVLKELPAKRRQVIEIAANGDAPVIERERAAWARSEERIADLRAAVELAKASESDDTYRAAVEALRAETTAAFTEMSRLRHETALAKLPHVIEHVRDAAEASGKVLVFAHHLDVIDALVAALGTLGVVKVDGREPIENRQASVDRFQTDPTCRVFVGQMRAAGVGLTLTAASHVVFAELDWVPGNLSQAEDRAHRIGQTESVLVQHLVLEGSLDAEMAQRLVAKQDVIDRALDVGAEELRFEPALPKIAKGEGDGSGASRKQVVAEAESLSEAEVAAIHQALRIVAGRCDGARERDEVGFNGLDTRIGKSLADAETLSAKQAALGRRIVAKYRRQIPEAIYEAMGLPVAKKEKAA